MRPLSPTRITGWVSLVPLVYFATEWIVSATWRGLYGYRDDAVGLLGVAFCGPVGNWPCSELYRAMNVANVVTGLAVVAVATLLVVVQRADRVSAVLLMMSGLGLATSGVITQNVSYSGNLNATLVFMSLGSVSALWIAVRSPTVMSVERRCVAVLAGLTGLVGFALYAVDPAIVGPGAAQRMCIYGILVVVIAIGTAGFAQVGADSDVRRDVEELA